MFTLVLINSIFLVWYGVFMWTRQILEIFKEDQLNTIFK